MIDNTYYIECSTEGTGGAQSVQDVETVGDNTKRQYIKIRIYYDRETVNYFSCSSKPRGIYASVTPVERDRYFESCKLFSGYKHCILELERWSKKAAQRIDQVEARRVIIAMYNAVIRDNRLYIPDPPAFVRVLDSIFDDINKGNY